MPPDWSKLKHFRETENWGNPKAMSQPLLELLDAYRDEIQTRVYVSCGTQGVHSPNSLHYGGEAVDIVFPDKNRPLIELFFEACRFGFGGIGIYPDWRYNGRPVGGLHLDVRPGPRKALWLGIVNSIDQTEYRALNLRELQAAKLLT